MDTKKNNSDNSAILTSDKIKEEKENIEKDKLKLQIQKKQYLSALRELRAEVQDLRDLFALVKEGKATTKENSGYFKKTYKDIQNIVKELNKFNQQYRSDTCRRIFNSWEKMQANPLLAYPEQERKAQKQLHDLSILDEEAGKIIFYVGQITIPHRLNKWLGVLRAGYYLPFHKLFEDEVPTFSDRVKILNMIAWAPRTLEDALVYPGNGLIYRYEKGFPKRCWSFIQVILTVLLMSALVWGVCFIGEKFVIDGWLFKPEHAPTFIISWVALLIGVIIHVGVESVKRSQSTGLPPVVAVNDWLKHVSARKGDIMLKLLIALFGLFSLIVSSDIEKLTTASAFLVGYSLDSFVGLFGTNVEQKAAAQATALKEQLGIKST